jgi:superfamily II DNA/RNA helicase
MQDDVPVTMRQIAARRAETQRGLSPPRELTSRVSSAEIRDMLDDMKRPVGDAAAIDVLLASSMISVGVDIPRLGLMMVVGQPKTIAEYIQATSRVGRGSVPGLIVGVYNTGRARDRSFFETFRTWHSSLYRDVEATSVTPFAPRAQDKALHAVLVALARHLVPTLRSDPPRISAQARRLLEQLVQPVLLRARDVDAREAASVMNRMKLLLDEWQLATNLEAYWDDFGKKRSLLISAEQDAAGEEDSDARRALWATPNSLREVEPTTAFKVLSGLATTETPNA